jgi:sec-independent protein translocase protein TatB
VFDFAWTQIGLIGVVALVLIGPKDLPIAIRTVAGLVKKARRMAGEFQSHVDEMVKDTELADIRNQISELRSFDIRREVEKAVDGDGTLRSALATNPLADPFPMPSAPTTSIVEGGTEGEAGHVSMAPATEPGFAAAGAAPAFIPPALVPRAPPRPVAPSFVPPAFVPPAATAPTLVTSDSAAPSHDRPAA